jgi:hypothetical protein
VPDTAAAAREGGDLAGEYLAQLAESFKRAAAAVGGAEEETLEIAGLRLTLRVAGEGLRKALLPPFDHLEVAGGPEPDLSISLFDTASTGVEPPSPTWQQPRAAPGTNPVARLRSERFSVLAAAGSGALTAAEPEAGRAFFHLPDATRIPASERAAPLRDALQLLMAARGRLMTHAGAVGRRGKGVLLVGPGGAGKSTLALACALAGMEIAGDDYVLLEPEPPTAHAMQSTAKLTEDSAERLGIPTAAIDSAGFEPTVEGPAKALVDIRALAPGKIRRHLEIGAVVAPSLGPGGPAPPVLRAISAAEGLRAVAPSTIVQSGFAGGPALAALARLVRRVPSYALELGPEPAANVEAIDRLVGELG